MRHYMPAKLKDFLEALTRQPSVREYVKHYKDRDLMAGYNGAVEALAHKICHSLHWSSLFAQFTLQTQKYT